MTPKALTVYVTGLAALAYRAYQHRHPVDLPAATGGPMTAMLQLKAADAINCAMRIETNGNIMVLEGTVDTPTAKKFWAKHGPRSLSLIRAAKKDAAVAADAWFAATEM